MGILQKLFDHDYKELKRFGVIADKVMSYEEEYSKLSDYELRAKTDEFKDRLEKVKHLMI